jgi:fluoride ion exporter CrcB/FEX
MPTSTIWFRSPAVIMLCATDLPPIAAPAEAIDADAGSLIQPLRPLGLRALVRFAPELTLLAMTIAAAVRTCDSDLWGHIRFGQEILSRRHLVLQDPYSYSAFGHLWRDHEWLSEVIMALLYKNFGIVGLKLWKITFSGATLALLSLCVAETGAPARLQLALLAVAAVAMTPLIQIRPQLFTFVLFAAMLALLARHNYRGSAPLWVAIPLMALWANLHGGFMIGIVTLWVYAGITGLEDIVDGRPRDRAIRLSLMAVCGTLATLATPYGTNTWIAVIHALRNPFTRSIIEDWKPPIAIIRSGGHVNYVYAYFCLHALSLMTALAVSCSLTRSREDLPLVAIAAIMSVGAFVAVRNLPLAAISCAAPVARHTALLQASKRPRSSVQTVGSFSSRTRWLIALFAVALVVVRTGLFSNLLRADQPYPSGAVEFMRRYGLHGNLLCYFNWGEYLIWHLAPSSKVFIDGRYDTVYPLRVIEDYVDFHFDLPGATQVVRHYPHNFVLVPPLSKPYAFMEKSPGWKLLYRDHDSALFARQGSSGAKLPGIPVISIAPSTPYFP